MVVASAAQKPIPAGRVEARRFFAPEAHEYWARIGHASGLINFSRPGFAAPNLELVWNLREVTQSNGKYDVVCAYGAMIQHDVEVIIDGDIQANHLGGLRHHTKSCLTRHFGASRSDDHETRQ
jgi:hypothetical protein